MRAPRDETIGHRTPLRDEPVTGERVVQWTRRFAGPDDDATMAVVVQAGPLMPTTACPLVQEIIVEDVTGTRRRFTRRFWWEPFKWPQNGNGFVDGNGDTFVIDFVSTIEASK